MLLWFVARPNLGKILAFCLGPFGSTVIFAVMTGALVYRLGWFGMGMAGLMGLLVATRLSEGENAGPRIPGTHFYFRHIRTQQGEPPRYRRHVRERPNQDPRTDKQSDSLHLVSASSLAMMAIGFVMFFRYQI